jgi:hypothetical protein
VDYAIVVVLQILSGIATLVIISLGLAVAFGDDARHQSGGRTAADEKPTTMPNSPTTSGGSTARRAIH